MAFLEEVFRISGVPTYTFVEPMRYDAIKVSVRTPGRCLIVEGPSGIGKTTTIAKIISDLGLQGKVSNLNARLPKDAEMIATLPDMTDIRHLTLPLEVIIEDVMNDLGRLFREAVTTFARGSKLRREGRAPYLHILRWLAESDEWSLDLAEAINAHPEHKASIGQVLEKGHLQALLDEPEKKPILEPYFYFEPAISVLSVEDPKLIFYLKNLIWRAFTKQVGFTSDYFKGKYDFALSFAGADRAHARRLYELLSEREVAIFYDENEQHRILAQNVEEYLAPIYRSEARYVVPLLSPEYPTRIWTKFESDNFKERFGSNAVIPIRYLTVVEGFFSDDQKYGGLRFDPKVDVEAQLTRIADTLCKRLFEDRHSAAA